ncbi:MAG: hypothetical protein Q7R45_04120, partial [Sulfuricaulis sp.]|nr:hypothetical protein [Sulfuricaulis sp.]
RVSGFCYPGGDCTREHRQMVADAGFDYARTIANFHRTLSADSFRMPTTIQYYPHRRSVLLKNFIRRGEWQKRNGLFRVAVMKGEFMSRLRAMLDFVCLHGGVFHLWGHSWEFERFDGWRQLHGFLRYAAERIPAEGRLNNRELLRYAVANSR